MSTLLSPRHGGIPPAYESISYLARVGFGSGTRRFFQYTVELQQHSHAKEHALAWTTDKSVPSN